LITPRRKTMKRPAGQWLVLGLLALALPAQGDEAARPSRKAPAALPLEKALKKARVNGKYEMLLRQFKVPKDYERYADFRDCGPKEATDYAGITGLPKGHWVYVYPYWYIWRDLASAPKPNRPWGPEQATGPPNTHQAGDIQTAWASRTPDDQDEWLLLEYAEPVVAEAVLVFETFNPGALNKVSVFKLDGEQVEVWKGKDPTPVNSGMGTSTIPFRVPFKTNRVKIYLDSKNVPGWNEIDAVGLRDTAGKTHWAVAADASSTYADTGGMQPAVGVPVRIRVVPAMPVAPPAAVPLPNPMPAVPLPNPMPAVPAPGPLPVAPAPAAVPIPGKPAPPKLQRFPAPAKTNEERIKQLEDEVKELKEAVKELKEMLKKK
jgi:hypothetical protein